MGEDSTGLTNAINCGKEGRPLLGGIMDTITCIPFVNGRPAASVEIRLNADGSADLSALPPDLRSHLEAYGVMDDLRHEAIYPAEGRAFLERLLDVAFPTARFLPAESV